MEPQQNQQNKQYQHQQAGNEEINNVGGGGGGGGGESAGKASFLCGQSSSRWTPTADQIRILKDLYYNNGVRSPSAKQIQRITARLRQYGKIEGKNVFYWFQNHKARERQKKRFTTITNANGINNLPIAMLQSSAACSATNWKHPDQDINYSIHNPNNQYSNFSSTGRIPSPSPSSGQMGDHRYGSVAVEKSFMDCSISAVSVGGSIRQHYGSWVGSDPYSTFLDKRKAMNETLEDEEEYEEDEEESIEIQTLPLFPMQREDINAFCSSIMHNYPNCCYTNWYAAATSDEAKSSSLELSLNSYAGRSPDSIELYGNLS